MSIMVNELPFLLSDLAETDLTGSAFFAVFPEERTAFDIESCSAVTVNRHGLQNIAVRCMICSAQCSVAGAFDICAVFTAYAAVIPQIIRNCTVCGNLRVNGFAVPADLNVIIIGVPLCFACPLSDILVKWVFSCYRRLFSSAGE